MKVQAGPLREAVAAIFAAAGCSSDESTGLAANLVDANLCGHDSHGVIRVVQYIRYVNNGTVKRGQTISIVAETPTLVVVDGNLGFGQTIGRQTMALLSSKAKASGLALSSIRNSSHFGRVGAWAEQLAADGLISLHFTTTTGLGMLAVPFGGTDRRLSLCVIAAAVPVDGRDPLLLDCATTTTAEGKLRVARNKGVPVPPGQIVDKDGNPSTDANDFYAGGAILPMAGHKGHGLTIIADLLAGALSGGGCTAPGVTLMNSSMTSIAIDPGPVTDREAYFAEIRRFCDWVTGSPPKDEAARVLLPGEIEHMTRAKRNRDSIAIDDETWRQIVETAASVGLDSDRFQELTSRQASETG